MGVGLDALRLSYKGSDHLRRDDANEYLSEERARGRPFFLLFRHKLSAFSLGPLRYIGRSRASRAYHAYFSIAPSRKHEFFNTPLSLRFSGAVARSCLPCVRGGGEERAGRVVRASPSLPSQQSVQRVKRFFDTLWASVSKPCSCPQRNSCA